MGTIVNPDNSAFQVALNSEIYVDKTGLIEYTNKVMNTFMQQPSKKIWKICHCKYAYSVLQQGM